MIASSVPKPRRMSPSRLKPNFSRNLNALAVLDGVIEVTRPHASWPNGYSRISVTSRGVRNFGEAEAKLIWMDL